MSLSSSSSPLWYHREIGLGTYGPDVAVVQRKLGLPPTGLFDRSTMERVMGMARKQKLDEDGSKVTPSVAEALGESDANKADLVPLWFKRELGPKDMFSASGEDVQDLRGRLGLSMHDDRYTPEVEDAVRRFQSYYGLPMDGVVDERLAKLIGE